MSRGRSGVYFYLKDGKVTGPIYLEDVQNMLSTGELSAMELLYAESEKVWKPVGEFDELASSGEVVPSGDDQLSDEVVSVESSQPDEPPHDSLLVEASEEDVTEKVEGTNLVEDSVTDIAQRQRSEFEVSGEVEESNEQNEEASSSASKNDEASAISKSLKETSEVSEVLEESAQVDGEALAEWVVLRKKAGFEDQYEQLGPLTQREVYDMIAKGELGFRDYVWTEGYVDWVLITEDESFKGRVAFWGEKQPVLPEIPTLTISSDDSRISDLANEKVSETDIDALFEDKNGGTPDDIETQTRPTEAAGPNLADELFAAKDSSAGLLEEDTVTNSAADDIDKSAVGAPQGSRNLSYESDGESDVSGDEKGLSKKSGHTEDVAKEQSRRKLVSSPSSFRRWLVIALNVALITGVIGVFVYATFGPSLRKAFFSKREARVLVPDSKANSPVPVEGAHSPPTGGQTRPELVKPGQSGLKIANKPQKAPPKKEVTKPLRPKIKPTFLTVKASRLSGDEAMVRFLTNGSEHYTVSFELVGRAGETLMRGAYRRVFRVPLRDGGRKLKFKQVRVPDGKYRYTAKIGTVESSGSLFVGKRDKAFRSKRGLARKQISPIHQVEKMLLVREAQKLFDVSTRFEKSVKTGFLKAKIKSDLKRDLSRIIRRLDAQLKQSILWRDQWEALRSIGAKLRDQEKAIVSSSRVTAQSKIRIKKLNSQVRSQLVAAESLSLY